MIKDNGQECKIYCPARTGRECRGGGRCPGTEPDVECWRRSTGCPWPLACGGPIVCASQTVRDTKTPCAPR